MNVQEFVRDVLIQVCAGVEEAQKVYPPTIPDGQQWFTNSAINYRDSGLVRVPQEVDVEISVEVVEVDGKAGFRVAAFGLEASRDGGTDGPRRTTANRVRFKVPVLFK